MVQGWLEAGGQAGLGCHLGWEVPGHVNVTALAMHGILQIGPGTSNTVGWGASTNAEVRKAPLAIWRLARPWLAWQV